MTDRKPAASNGFQSAETCELTDAALEECDSDPLRLGEQGASSRSRRPKLQTRTVFWTLVLALPVTIGALVVAIGILGMLLRSMSHEVAGI